MFFKKEVEFQHIQLTKYFVVSVVIYISNWD